jgi:hypothetical protein
MLRRFTGPAEKLTRLRLRPTSCRGRSYWCTPARDYARGAKAAATQRAYAADWRHYTAWCRRRGLDPELDAACSTRQVQGRAEVRPTLRKVFHYFRCLQRGIQQRNRAIDVFGLIHVFGVGT